MTAENGISDKSINDFNGAFAEYGLRMMVDWGNSPVKGDKGSYQGLIIDVLKKEQREDVKQQVNE
jgi:hypothetical protein